MKTRKILSLALALVLCLSLFPTALAAEADAGESAGADATVASDPAYTVKRVTEFAYDEVQFLDNGPTAVCVDGKWGFIDETGKAIVEPTYDGIGSHYWGWESVGDGVYLLPVEKDGKWGFIDQTGAVVIDLKYDLVATSDDEDSSYYWEWVGDTLLHPVKRDDKWGFIDPTGAEVIEPQYDRLGLLVWDYAGGLSRCTVKKDGKWGVIDGNNETVVDFQYDAVGTNFDYVGDDTYFLAVENENGLGFVDVTTGAEVIPCQYADIFDDYDFVSCYWLEKDGKAVCAVPKTNEDGETYYGAIDLDGNVIFDFIADDISWSDNGIARVRMRSSEADLLGYGYWEKIYGYIDMDGNIIAGLEPSENKYLYGNWFYEGYAAVEIGVSDDTGMKYKYILIDEEGNEIVPENSYSSIGNFSNGLARAKSSEGYGLIDYTGKEVVPCKYNWIESFHEGLAQVGATEEENDTVLYGFIDKEGNKIVPCEYGDTEYRYTDSRVAAEKDGTVYVLDAQGNEVTSLEGSFGGRQGDLLEIGKVTDDGYVYNYGLFDLSGRVIFPCAYGNIDYSFWYTGLVAAADAETDKWAVFSVSGGVFENELTLDNNGRSLSVKKGGSATVTATLTGHEGRSLYAISDDTDAVSVSVSGNEITVTGEAAGGAEVIVFAARSGDVSLSDVWAYDSSQRAYLWVNVSGSSSSNNSSNSSSSSSGSGNTTAGSGRVIGNSAATPVTTPDEPEEATETPASELFADVEKDSWYEDGVTYVVSESLFVGVGDGTFAPTLNMSRAMLWTVLARKAGVDTSAGDTWYDAGLSWAVENGVSDGSRAEDAVTRMEIVTMLWRDAGSPESDVDLSDFVDADQVPDWALDAIEWAVENGILTGKDGSRLDPLGEATRAEVAVLLERLWNVKE